jgi:hypothetical protein
MIIQCNVTVARIVQVFKSETREGTQTYLMLAIPRHNRQREGASAVLFQDSPSLHGWMNGWMVAACDGLLQTIHFSWSLMFQLLWDVFSQRSIL